MAKRDIKNAAPAKVLKQFEGGATRTFAFRYDLVPQAAVRGIARRFTIGAQKHGENNWRNGGKEFRKATLAHLIKHAFAYAEHGGQDDLDAIGCNFAMLAELEERVAFNPRAGEKRRKR